MTQDDLKNIWEYLPITDSFIWKIGSKFRAIGSSVPINDRIFILGKEYRYSRLKQLYLEGVYREFTVIDTGQLTHAQLLTILHYDPFTGIFTWKESRGPNKKGDIAGHIRDSKYIEIRIARKAYLAHRLAWFYCFEEWPEFNIDHIDRNPSNNALDNLRDLPQIWNGRNRDLNKNNTSGYTGVHLNKGKWVAEIIINKIKHRLGVFDTPEEASTAYKLFEKENTYANISIG